LSSRLSCSTRQRNLASRTSSSFPVAHRSKLRSTNPLEWVNREIGRRTDEVGVFPNDAALLRLRAAC
jgi:transposase-like protein